MNVSRTLLTLALALAIYLLLNVSPDRQYALITAAAAFVIMYAFPLVQTYYSRQQTEIARRQEIRDVVREEREDAERRKRPQLAVTLYGTNHNEFFPIGGHRDPSASLNFEIYIENMGDAPAQDVVVHFGLPAWVHEARYVVDVGARGQSRVVLRERRPDDLEFEPRGLPGFPGCNEVAMVTIGRPVYPGQPWRLGLVSVNMPAGTHKFPWIIDSSAGRTTSDDDSALTITAHETARFHEQISWNSLQNRTAVCRFCERTRSMTPSEVYEYVRGVSGRRKVTHFSPGSIV